MNQVLTIWIATYVLAYFYWQLIGAYVLKHSEFKALGILLTVAIPRATVATAFAGCYWLWTH